MRIALLGGSFNPIHIGHLGVAQTVLERFSYDVVLFVPANISPFKTGNEGTLNQDRLDMINAAIAGNTRLGVDMCELQRGGISYTIDTVKDIEKRYQPADRIGLIIGDDLVKEFHAWKDADELVARTTIIVATRYEEKALQFEYPHLVLGNSIINVSSSEIREYIARGRPWHQFLPEKVCWIIEEQHLYGYQGNLSTPLLLSPSLISRIEETARSFLTTERFVHSKQVALMAKDLCDRFGEDPVKGYIAGIAHDMCKGFSSEKLYTLATKDGNPISPLEQNKPSLLHGRAAAMLVKEYFDIEDEYILQAIRAHTFGMIDMSSLAKIVYIADKLEPSRDHIPDSLRQQIKLSDLDTLFIVVLNDTVQYLQEHGKVLADETRQLLALIRRDTKYESI